MTTFVSENNESVKTTRPPIIVVMGHIDHGKTKILDWYRKTKVVEQESGGITQHIGAYEFEYNGKQITFIDTPGHEAFTKLRSRGATVADIAILVVAADEGVKPQTKEALAIIHEHGLPFVVAFNKIDKSEANPERIKQQLAEEGVLVESYGGKIPSVEVSAKEGRNMDELLEVLLLLAELENLEANPEKPAEGVVVEAHLDSRRGNTATLLVRDGTLMRSAVLVIGRTLETIKVFEDFRGRSIVSAGPSTPVVLAGFSYIPVAGDLFRAFRTRGEAEAFVAASPPEEIMEKKFMTSEEAGKPIFNIILKADVVGSKEALEESLGKISSPAVGINIIRSEVGDINESDVKLATATKLVTIVGFKVHVDPVVKELARTSNIHIVTSEVIYALLDEMKKNIEELLPPEIVRHLIGRVKILKLFKRDGVKQVIGGRVEDGVIRKSVITEVKRMKEIKGRGIIRELQRERTPTDTVEKGLECGILFESPTAIEEGDILEVFEEETIKRTL